MLFNSYGFIFLYLPVVLYSADAALGEVHKKYQLGGDELYLLCRGEACRK